MCVCVCACISAIEIQTTGLILVKFGMGILLNAGMVRSWDSTPYPDPRGQGVTYFHQFIYSSNNYLAEITREQGSVQVTPPSHVLSVCGS
jgi:hypothetical protein